VQDDQPEIADPASLGAGLVVAVAVILILTVIAVAALWAAPWGDEAPIAPGAPDSGLPAEGDPEVGP
jgi:hypothetical protein